MGRSPVFDIQLVGLIKETKQTTDLFTVTPGILIQNVNKTDFFIIPAIHGDQTKARELNKEFIPWLIKQYKTGAEIASFCIGSFFLASTGLLKGM